MEAGQVVVEVCLQSLGLTGRRRCPGPGVGSDPKFLAGLPGQLPVLLCHQGGRQSGARPLAAVAGSGGPTAPLNALWWQVQSEIRRAWHRCRLRRGLGDGPRRPSERASVILPLDPSPGPPGSVLAQGTLPKPAQDEASRVVDSYC